MGRRANLQLATVLALGLVAANSGCGNTLAHNSPIQQRWGVAATVQMHPDGYAGACYPVTQASLPPPPCSSIPLANVGAWQLPIDHQLLDGTLATPPLRLVGTWTGTSLLLETQPRVVTRIDGRPSIPSGDRTDPPSDDLANRERMIADKGALRQRGIWVIEAGFSSGGSYAVVAVDNGAATGYLRAHYAVDYVLAWMKAAT